MTDPKLYLAWDKPLLFLLLAVFHYSVTQRIDVSEFAARIMDMADRFLGVDDFQVRRF